MKTQKENGFVVTTDADEGTAIVTLMEAGDEVTSVTFNVGEIKGSVLFDTYLVKSIWPMLGARTSQLKGEEKIQAAIDVWHDWCSGTWEQPRKGGIRTISLEVEAIAKMTGQGIKAAAESWKQASDETRKRIKELPAYQEAEAKVKALRAQADAESIDLSNLLDA